MKNTNSNQEIIMTKWAGLEGTYIIAQEKHDELTTRYTRTFIDGAKNFDDFLSIEQEVKIAKEAEISSYYAANEGGIFGALWDMAKAINCGISVDLKKILLKQETVEICEFFDLNPYMLLSGGCMLFVTDKSEDLIIELKKEGIEATIIGKVNNIKQRVIRNNGEKRYLTPYKGDEVYKIVSKRSN